MDKCLNLLAVPKSMRYEKYADIFSSSITTVFNLNEEIKELFFMELIYFYRKYKEEDETLQTKTIFDFYQYLEEIYEKNNEKNYKKALFYLSLIIGEENSEQRNSIGNPQKGSGEIIVLGMKNYDDYFNSPKYLEWANEFIKKIQENLGNVYKR